MTPDAEGHETDMDVELASPAEMRQQVKEFIEFLPLLCEKPEDAFLAEFDLRLARLNALSRPVQSGRLSGWRRWRTHLTLHRRSLTKARLSPSP